MHTTDFFDRLRVPESSEFGSFSSCGACRYEPCNSAAESNSNRVILRNIPSTETGIVNFWRCYENPPFFAVFFVQTYLTFPPCKSRIVCGMVCAARVHPGSVFIFIRQKPVIWELRHMAFYLC